jgi:transketolase
MTVVALGPLAGSYIETFTRLPADIRPNLWALCELPLERHPMPEELIAQISAGPGLCVIEEHVRQGGVASQLALYLASRGLSPKRFESLHARAHRFDEYGSQLWMRSASGLDPETVLKVVTA